MTLTAVVADDSVLLREGICRLLADESITVLGQAGDGNGLLELVRIHRPNIAIVDIRMVISPLEMSTTSLPPRSTLALPNSKV